jgi:hypothetical protein
MSIKVLSACRHSSGILLTALQVFLDKIIYEVGYSTGFSLLQVTYQAEKYKGN